MHALVEFMRRSGRRQSDLAREAGVRPGVLCDVLKGRRRRFSPEVAQRLHEATQGEVSLQALLGLPEPTSQSPVQGAGSVAAKGGTT